MKRNLRDFSNYRNRDGKKLGKLTFIRSSHLSGLRKNEIDFLSRTGKLSVIDLRTETERNEKPDHMFDGYYPISILSEARAGISHEAETDTKREIPDMRIMYRNLMLDEYSVNAFRKVFEVICSDDREGSVLWHCSEGKDRCGLVSALFMAMMDFDREVIIRDYLKSLKHSGARALKYYLLIRCFKKDKALAESVRDAFLVKREYLESAFRTIDEKYGSIYGFLDHIGVDETVRKRMKKKYLI